MWFHTALAKPRTASSRTWWLPRAPARSRRDRPAARTASPSTINCCASKKSSARAQSSPAATLSGKKLSNERLPTPNAGPQKAFGFDDFGWMGLLPIHRRKRDRRRAKTDLRYSAAGVSKHRDPHLRPLRWIAGRADGQQRGWASQYRRG